MRIAIEKLSPCMFVVYVNGVSQGLFGSRQTAEEWLAAEVDESWADYEVKK